MTVPSPFTALGRALQSACSRDLPPYPASRSHPVAKRAHEAVAPQDEAASPGLARAVRAVPEQCEVVMFLQTWPATTARGARGAAASPLQAYTVIVRWRVSGVRAVYFGESGGLAYLIPAGLHEVQLQRFIGEQSMPDVRAAAALGWKPRL